MAYDALVSVGVVAAGGVILLTGWMRLDPLVSHRVVSGDGSAFIVLRFVNRTLFPSSLTE